MDSETKTSSLGLTFSMPLYRGGGISSRIRQSASLLDAEIEGLRFQEEDLKKKVQKSVLQYAGEYKVKRCTKISN